MMVNQSSSTDTLDRVASLLRDIESNTRTNSTATRRSSARPESPASPIDQPQLPEDGADTSANVAVEPISSRPVRVEIPKGIITLPNQDTITGIDCRDLQRSLSFRFSQSQWMTMVMWFSFLQFLALVAIIFMFLIFGKYMPVEDVNKPSSLLKSSLFSGFVVQPLNSFVIVALGLYISDGRASKLHLRLLCILIFLTLMAWSIFTVLPFTSSHYRWYYALGPFIITVIQFIYLSFR